MIDLRTTASRGATATLTLVFLCSPPSPGAAQTVGWWRFEEGRPGFPALLPGSIVDQGTANNGSPIGSPVYVADECWGGGLAFDGIDSRITIPDAEAYARLRSLTLEAVFSTTGYNPSPYALNQILFRGDDRGAIDPFFLAIESTGHAGFYIYNTRILGTPDPVPTGVVIFLAVTLDDQTGEAVLYVNGSPVAQTTTSARPTGPLTGPNPGLGIGNVQSGNFAQYLSGSVYEVRLSDAALTPPSFLVCYCAADFNGDQTADFFDYLDFVAAFARDDPAADFNRDETVDFFDYLDFVATFDAGCD